MLITQLAFQLKEKSCGFKKNNSLIEQPKRNAL
jgi:hypothetical protein